ncbi:YybH family protein [Chryseolinea lacunae]|uniref:Nuclear transport factor 2 family protein n=1 Tax=Chryseolinea lacunae TaxID=2801331 RepID=A0ABS1KXT2_9BACT|nr:DUF4440 domain-containing protein [Chryseolinea lacunae]MBL0743121.1 nuclear transport factor 2 family protein [Chryseolinea lacunae]
MPKIKFILLLACLAVMIRNAWSQTKPDEQAQAYLKQFRSDVAKSMVGKKPEAIVAYYDDNLRLMPAFQKTIVGKANVLAYRKAFASRFDVREYNMMEMDVIDLGTLVAEVGTFTQKMKLKSTGKDFDWKGKYLNLWKKQENKTLRLITEAWNYDHPTDDANQLKFADVPNEDVAVMSHVNINNNISFELAALNRLMEATVSQHDAAIWAQFYADDGMFLYSGQPLRKGKKALEDFLVEHCKGLPVFEKLDIRNDHIDHLGMYVIEYASHFAAVRSGDWSGVGLGKDLRIWRREKDGSLKIMWHIAMYD